MTLQWAPGLLLVGCLGSTGDDRPLPLPPETGTSRNSGGASAGGSTEMPIAGAPQTGGSGGAGTGGTTSAAGDGGAASGGEVGAPSEPDPLAVMPSAGCGMAPTQVTGEFVLHTIQTSGTKQNLDTNGNGVDDPGEIFVTGKVGDWSYLREYYLWLPPDYDSSHAYPLVIQGPGCSGSGLAVYSLSPTNGTGDEGVNGSVIRVGLTPPPNDIQHIEALNSGCFDDKEGDDSVDFVFYEALIDVLKATLCYDENRVFASGNSSGAWLANELGCKYAGDTEGYAIRGIAVNMGGLPTDPERVPTCTTAPMAGMWVWVDDGIGFPSHQVAVARALGVNGCTATSWDVSSKENYPINGLPDGTCQKLTDCPDDAYPLVTCRVDGSDHGAHEEVANPGFAAFLQSLMVP